MSQAYANEQPSCCTVYYLFDKRPMCLHDLFKSGLVSFVVKETGRYSKNIAFYIYRDKVNKDSKAWKRKWWVNGTRSKLNSRKQILLAIDLSEKYNVRRVKI